jgi:hypothetical protein
MTGNRYRSLLKMGKIVSRKNTAPQSVGLSTNFTSLMIEALARKRPHDEEQELGPLALLKDWYPMLRGEREEAKACMK